MCMLHHRLSVQCNHPYFAVQHFDAMDDLAQKMQHVQSALGLATAFEKYSEAADLKKQLDQLNANDVVEQVLQVTHTSV